MPTRPLKNYLSDGRDRGWQLSLTKISSEQDSDGSHLELWESIRPINYTDLTNRDDLAGRRRIDVALNGRVAIQRKVCPPFAVVFEIRTSNPSKMMFVDNDGVIQTLASIRADKAFAIEIVPQRLWRADNLFQAQEQFR